MNVPKPYQGKDKFIFISYSHRDTAKVFPIIYSLVENGYRVWYDQGIDPGTEWDENIATHIDTCGYFIAFMSNNYLGSSNCKDELNYARDLEKDRLIVYLEEVTLPAGMAMRINRLQSIFRYAYTNDDDFYEKLFAANNINVCLSEKAPEVKAEPAPAVNVTAEAKEAAPTVESNPFGGQPAEQVVPKIITDAVNTIVDEMNIPPVTPDESAPVDAKAGIKAKAPIGAKSRTTAAMLAIFLGWIGVHKFYLGKKLYGILYILALFIRGVSVILGIIDGIILLTTTDENFMKKYNCKLK